MTFPITQRKLGWHPTPKPLVFMEWLVSRFDAETVFDPFCGTGTTGVACKRLGRKFVGIEINPQYIGIARDRIEGAAPCLEL